MVSFKVYYEANIANAEHVKHEMISLLKTNSRTKPNLEPGGAIYNWFTNNLMKWLTGPGDPHPWRLGRTAFGGPEHQEGAEVAGPEDIIGLEPHEYKEGEPEWMKKPGVMDFTDTGNWPKLDHIIDYFNSLSDREREKIVKKPYDQVEKEVAAWDEKLAKAEISETNLKEDTDYEVIGKDGDYTWVKLSSKAAYECEGSSMGHCVGGYDPDDEDNTIISLWDKKGEPHVTIEISGRKDGYQEIRQIKGKQNAAPAEKYKDIAAKFVRGWLDESPWNEDPADPDRLVAGDGANIGMISYPDWSGGRNTGTYYFFPDSKIWEAIHKKEIVPRQKHQVKSNQKAIHNDPGYGKYINGNLNLSYGYFKEIPKQLKVDAVEGDLNLQTNLLTSLKNAPNDVEGDLYAGANYIETLEGGPEIVRGDYKIAYNKLKNLKGLAKKIGGNLHIEGNPLESLDGAQDTVVMGKVFVGGWPVDMDDRGDVDRLATDTVGPVHRAAPDFMKADKIRAAFKTPQEGPDRGPGRMGLAYLPPRTQY